MTRIFIIIAFISMVSCKAQTTYPLLDEGVGLLPDAYYKDTYNELDKFAGTWRYQSGNIIFDITLQKKVMMYDPYFDNYADMLIGEYKYVDSNGVTVVTTQSNLQVPLGPFKNNISGAYIMDSGLPSSERRVKLQFVDPDRDYLNRYITVKHVSAQGSVPEKILIEFSGESSAVTDDTSPTTLRVPEQNYTLTKVP